VTKKVLIILADGFEEIEAVVPIDVLKRAELDVTIAGLGQKLVTGAHGLKVETDVVLHNYDDLPDCIVLPGGMPGSKHLQASKEVKEIVQKMDEQKKLVTAICASPALTLASAGVLAGRKATCYPGFENNFTKETTFLEDRVVVDQHIITSRGPGSAMEYALKLVEQLAGGEKAAVLKKALLVK
jgi:protein deglycase